MPGPEGGFQPIPEQRRKRVTESQHLKFEVTEDLDEARDQVRDMIARGIRPVITIPEEWIERIREEGIPLIRKFDRKSGKAYEVTAARLGADPFLPAGEERFVAEIDPEGLDVQPRLTGTPPAFYGTVTFPRGIAKEKINVLGKFSKESWDEREQEKAA